MNKKIRSVLLGIVLGVYNAAVFIAMNVLLWRNHMWNSGKWTDVRASKDDDKAYASSLSNISL